MASPILPVLTQCAASCRDRLFFRLFLSLHCLYADCATFRQFPQSPLATPATTPAHRKASAQKYVSSLNLGNVDMSKAHYVAAFPPLVHVFTHIRLTMHAYQFRVACDKAEDVELIFAGPPARKWVSSDSMHEQTLSTGMRKCWDLVAKSV